MNINLNSPGAKIVLFLETVVVSGSSVFKIHFLWLKICFNMYMFVPFSINFRVKLLPFFCNPCRTKKKNLYGLIENCIHPLFLSSLIPPIISLLRCQLRIGTPRKLLIGYQILVLRMDILQIGVHKNPITLHWKSQPWNSISAILNWDPRFREY